MKTALVLAAAVCLSVAAAFTALAAQTFQITASIGSCLIGSGQNTVDISLSSNGDTTGTDGKIYLFELRPYESEIGSRTDYVSSVGAGETRTVSIPLNKGTAFTAGLFRQCLTELHLRQLERHIISQIRRWLHPIRMRLRRR